jgi:ADP-ribose pyrophosphatase
MSILEEKTVRSRSVYSGRVIGVRVDEVTLPDGRPAAREVVEHPGAVAIVALTPDNKLLMVRQWRHPAGRELVEIPAGSLKAGEDPAECALRELEEETGYRAERVEPLVGFYSAPGFCAEFLYVFVARGLSKSETNLDEDEFVQVEPVPWEDALRMCQDGRVQDAKTLVAILSTERLGGREWLAGGPA